MRMKTKIIFLLLIATASTGCRYSFDIEDSGLEPRICVKSYICADSTTVIEIHRTIPVDEISSTASATISPSFSLLCNGEEIETASTGMANGGMRIEAGAFSEGDRLSLTVGADDLETVKAETSIPDGFPEYTFEAYTDADGNKCVLLSYKDNPQSRDYYGAAVEVRRFEYYPHSESPSVNTSFTIVDDTEISLDRYAYAPVTAWFEEHDTFIWSDEEEDDDCYEMRSRLSLSLQYEVTEEVRLHLYRLSEEMYRTLYAYYDAHSNPFASVGLSSPSFTYSNVNRGVGYFCGYTKTVSEWMEIK